MSRVVLEAKRVGETRAYSFDYTSALATTETISTKSVAATVYSGTDASPSSIISGAASSTGASVAQKVTGGIAGVIYQLVCTVTTSTGQTLQLVAFLAVIPDLI